MATLLHTRCVTHLSAVDPLDVLEHLAGTFGGDMALLHSGTGRGQSVLGFGQLCTLSIDAQGVPSVCFPPALGTLLPPPNEDDPLGVLQHVIAAAPFDAPHPLVGWLGFISYDIGRTLEAIPSHAVDELRWPLLFWSLYANYLVFDQVAKTVAVFTVEEEARDPAGVVEMLEMVRSKAQCAAMKHAQRGPCPTEHGTQTRSGGAAPVIVEEQAAEAFCEKVRRVQEYISAGDIYQANLAQRWKVRTAESPVRTFRRLCKESPAHYAAYLRIKTPAGGQLVERHILSASPELFLTIADGRAVTRPIKGTRPRDLHDAGRDGALREELLASAKDQAELAMIVDLLRNDLGRVAQFGSVRVTEARAMEAHPTVWHTVATIEADLRRDVKLAEILAAVCPGGSITGAPKIRAMQIIEELEGFRRALYCGNIGVISPDARSMALNIASRTILMQEGMAYVYAGGGVVADSDPQLEYEETLHKAAAMFRALGINRK